MVSRTARLSLRGSGSAYATVRAEFARTSHAMRRYCGESIASVSKKRWYSSAKAIRSKVVSFHFWWSNSSQHDLESVGPYSDAVWQAYCVWVGNDSSQRGDRLERTAWRDGSRRRRQLQRIFARRDADRAALV